MGVTMSDVVEAMVVHDELASNSLVREAVILKRQETTNKKQKLAEATEEERAEYAKLHEDMIGLFKDKRYGAWYGEMIEERLVQSKEYTETLNDVSHAKLTAESFNSCFDQMDMVANFLVDEQPLVHLRTQIRYFEGMLEQIKADTRIPHEDTLNTSSDDCILPGVAIFSRVCKGTHAKLAGEITNILYSLRRTEDRIAPVVSRLNTATLNQTVLPVTPANVVKGAGAHMSLCEFPHAAAKLAPGPAVAIPETTLWQHQAKILKQVAQDINELKKKRK